MGDTVERVNITLPRRVLPIAEQEVAQPLAQLPDDATLEDIQYHVYVLEKIQRGRADLAAGRRFK